MFSSFKYVQTILWFVTFVQSCKTSAIIWKGKGR